MTRGPESGRWRIGFVGPVPPIRGGIAQHSARLVDALRARGHAVKVMSWAAQYPSALYPGEQMQPSPSRGDDVAWALRWWSPASWLRTGRQLRDVDVVVHSWVHPFHALAIRTIVEASGRPRVAVVHNLLPHEGMRGSRSLARLGLHGAAGVLVHASDVASEVDSALPGVPIGQVPHPPNLDVSAVDLPKGPPRALFLGYVRPYKGVDLLLDALTSPALRAMNVHATIAGEMWDPDEHGLAAMVATRGLQDRVSLEPGYASDERVDELLASHHVLVGPYRTATQSGVVPLAHAAARPAVVTDVGGLREQVRDGVDGVVVSGGSADAIAEGIERCLSDLEKLAEGARSSATTWDDVAAKVELLVSAALQSSAPPMGGQT